MTQCVIDDGITHINIYSKGRTELGRLLSNFAHTPFKNEAIGSFQSIEGFWYWLSTGRKHDELRELYGSAAKEFGRKLDKVYVDDFIANVENAIRLKIEQNERVCKLLKQSTLPFEHYYWYGSIHNPKIQNPMTAVG